MMDALEFFGRAVLVLAGLTAAVHFHLMSNAAQRAPWLLKYITYPATAGLGLCAAVCAVVPGSLFLLAALWSAAGALVGALVVGLAVWRAGVHVCDVMDHAEALRAAKQVQSVLSAAQRDASVLGQRMTYSSWDTLASMDQDPRDNPRKDAP
jgi:hypothetical protein